MGTLGGIAELAKEAQARGVAGMAALPGPAAAGAPARPSGPWTQP
jgi:hypothetical protein